MLGWTITGPSDSVSFVPEREYGASHDLFTIGSKTRHGYWYFLKSS